MRLAAPRAQQAAEFSSWHPGNACGTAFKLTPASNGKFNRTLLYAFDDKHGANPNAGVILDAMGNIFGTAVGGGSDGFGVVFVITP